MRISFWLIFIFLLILLKISSFLRRRWGLSIMCHWWVGCIAMLVFFGINTHSSSASTVKENRVRQEIKEAQQLVTRLERESEQAHQESGRAQTNLQEVLSELDMAQSRMEAVAREQAAVWRSIQEGTQWIDDEISRRKADIEIARIMGNQEEVAHLEREIAAYEKQRQKALSEPTVQLQRLKEEGLKAALQRGEAENLVYRHKAAADAAEQKALRIDQELARARTRLSDLLLKAPEELADTAPPYLKRVSVSRGETVFYEAQWVPRSEEIERVIEILRRKIHAQERHVAEADENSNKWLAEMHATLKELNQAQERYQTKLWEYALMAVYLDLAESAYSIASNLETFGPFAFLLEAAWRVGEAATGQFDLPEDELPRLIIKEPLRQGAYVKGAQKAALRAYVDKWVEQVIAGSDAKGLLWDEGFWAVIHSEVILDGKVEAHIIREAFVRHKPREYMDAFRRHLKDPKFWGNVATGIGISSAREYLFEEKAHKERLIALAELATATSTHNLALSMAQSSINEYILSMDALEVMQEKLAELIREKDQAQDRRDLEHGKDEVLKGEGTAVLRLEFSGPVAVQGVILGGKIISGEPSGDKSWEGKFTLENLPDTATLEVKATDPLTGKELDNPDTVARYAPTKEAWIGYEAGPDRHHLIQLGLGPPYLKSVQFESDGEVYYKAAWVVREGTEERVLEREIDKIVDIEEIKKGEIGLTFSKPVEKVLLLVGEREFNVSPAEGNRVFRGTVVFAGLEPEGEIPIEVAARDAHDNTIDGNPATIARPPNGGYEKERDRSHKIKTGESLTGGRFLVDSVLRIADAKEINPHLTHFTVVGEKRLDWGMGFKIDSDHRQGDPLISEEWAGEEGARVPEFDSSRLLSGVDDKSFKDAEVSTAAYDMCWDSNTATKAGILQGGHEPFHFTATVRIFFTTLYRQSGLEGYKGFDDTIRQAPFMKGRKLTAEELAARNIPFKVAFISDTKDKSEQLPGFKFHGFHVKYYLIVEVLGYGSDGTRPFPESAGELGWKVVNKISSNLRHFKSIDKPIPKEEATGGTNQPSEEGVMKQAGPSAALPDIPPQEVQSPSEISGGSLESSLSQTNWRPEWNETTK